MLDLNNIPAALEHQGRLSRRLFLGYMGALAAIPYLTPTASASTTAARTRYASNPFTMGVASGDPDATSVVLWTRLALDPLAADGGITESTLEVAWEVAEDDAMTKVVRSGTTFATDQLAHSVHVEVAGLRPDRWYFYRFRSGDFQTPVARTRTLPELSATPDKLAFAFASCQHYETGHYTAFKHMAADNLDLVFHLGDYIYEGAPRDNGVRKHTGGLLMSLADYRIRHAQYRTDPHLQAAHAHCPWFVTWDDHEVSNNYANDIDGRPGMTPAEFLYRRAAGYQAYYEMMPLRARSMPKGPNLLLYRQAAFGQLAQFNILDTRQYRTDQPNNDRASPLNAAALDPHQTILGSEQKTWLKDSLAASPATWNVLAQQVMMGMLVRPRNPSTRPTTEPAPTTAPEDHFSMDAWTGYAAERMEIVRHLAERNIRNTVVLTGDVHANYANELRIDDGEHDSPLVATEFVGTSISSGGDGQDIPNGLPTLLAANPCLKYHNRERGYVRCSLTPKTWTTDFLTVEKVTTPDAPLKTRASFTVESGNPAIQKS